MRIIEIKSQNLKIIYQPTVSQLRVGDFVSCKENNLELIAQVLNISTFPAAEGYNQADLSFVLTNLFDKISVWNGELVSAEAKVEKTQINDVADYINGNATGNKIIIGSYSGDDFGLLKYNVNNFLTPAVVASDKPAESIEFIRRLSLQLSNLNKKCLILDYNGNIEIDGAQRVMAGYQDKLPLNADLLENLSSKILEGVSADSKIIIEDILFELADYANTCPSGFISLGSLINVLDNIYKKSKIAQLILLKNKLRRYQKNNMFADTATEVNALSDAINGGNSIIIYDLSSIPFEWQKEFFSKLTRTLENNQLNDDIYLYTPIDNNNFDNKIANYLLFKADKFGIKPIINIAYSFTAFCKILEFCKNAFLFKTNIVLNKQPILGSMIQGLPLGHFVAYGKLTSYIPICSYFGEDDIALNNLEQNSEVNETLDIIQDTIDVNSLYEDEKPIATADMDSLNTALSPEPSILLTPQNRLNEEPALEIEDNAISIQETTDDSQIIEQMPKEEISAIENINIDDVKNEEEIQENVPIVDDEVSVIEPTEDVFSMGENVNSEEVQNTDGLTPQEDIVEKNQEVAEVSQPRNNVLPTLNLEDVAKLIVDEGNEAPLELHEIEPEQIIESKEIVEEIENNLETDETIIAIEQQELLSENTIDVQQNINAEVQPDTVTEEDVAALESLEAIQENINELQEPQNNEVENETVIEDTGIEEKEPDLSDSVNSAAVNFSTDSENDDEVEVENINFEELDELEVVEQNLEDFSPEELDFADDMQHNDNQVQQTNNDDDELLDLLDDDAFNDITDLDTADKQQDEFTADIDDLEQIDEVQDEVKHVAPLQKLPVYSANYEDSTEKIGIDLKEGDLVKHNKYGLGTIKKVTSHGNKVLCHINFEDFGRRLLDPEISQLEKIE